MNLGTASRFAVLDDDCEGKNNINRSSLPPAPNKSSNSLNNNCTKLLKEKQSLKKHKGYKSKGKGIDPELQSLAFGFGRHKKNNSNMSSNTDKYSRELNVSTKLSANENGDQQYYDYDELYHEQLKEALIRSEREYKERQMLNQKPETKVKSEPFQRMLNLETFDDEEFEENENYLFENKNNANSDSSKNRNPDLDLSESLSTNHRFSSQIEEENVQLREDNLRKDEKIVDLIEKLAEALETKALLEKEFAKLERTNSQSLLNGQSIEDLIKEKDELNDEVARLHVIIEQERSKNHLLQTQLQLHNVRRDFK